MKKRALIIFILLSLALGWLPPQAARADVAPPPEPALGGLSPFEYQDTNVQMIYERVEIELVDLLVDPDFFSAPQQANVVAWFVMRNLGSTAEQMQAVFPLKSLNDCLHYDQLPGPPSYAHYLSDPDSFVIRVDGERVTTTVVTTDYPDQRPRYQSCDPMEWVAFDVSFPVEQDVLIRVEYHMDIMGRDALQTIEYILETGAGWKGPIGQAYVIFRLPYLANTENILSATTPGYQFLYNEIFWSYEDLEPTPQDNILVSVIDPSTWGSILDLRNAIQTNPADITAWRELASTYWRIAHWHGSELREATYAQKALDTYQLAIAANPESAALYAKYADAIWSDCCYYFPYEPMSETDRDRILALLDKALTFDPSNQEALEMLQRIKEQFPDLDYTPPATFTPTVTPSPTQIRPPTITPTPTRTPHPTITRTPLRTYRPTITSRPTLTQRPTQTTAPTNTTTVAAPIVTLTPVPTATATAAPTWVAQATSPVGLAVLGGILALHAAVFAWRRRSRG